jgi:hypothetical protein
VRIKFKLDLMKISCEDRRWIELAHIGVQCWNLILLGLILRVLLI